MNNQNTQDIGIIHESNIEVSDILEQVYEALSEKGYNPVSQIVGYVMSGDPTYITSYKNARSLIMKAERDEISWRCIVRCNLFDCTATRDDRAKTRK